jgi:hypothetical protein
MEIRGGDFWSIFGEKKRARLFKSDVFVFKEGIFLRRDFERKKRLFTAMDFEAII